MTQKNLFRRGISKTLVLAVITIAVILAVSLHPAAPLQDLIHTYPVLKSLHIDDLALSLSFALIVLMLVAITQIKRAYISEHELAKYRARHQELLENLPIAVAEFDSKQQVKITNHAFKQFNERIDDTTRKVLIQKLSDQLAASKNTSDLLLKQAYPTSNSLDTLWIEWNFHRRPDHSYLLLGRDISQQENVKEKLSISHRILEHTPIGVMVVDTNFSIEYTNRSFELITGYSATEALGKNPSILHSGKHDSHFFRTLYDSIKDRGHWQGEIWNRKKKRRYIPRVALHYCTER